MCKEYNTCVGHGVGGEHEPRVARSTVVGVDLDCHCTASDKSISMVISREKGTHPASTAMPATVIYGINPMPAVNTLIGRRYETFRYG